MSRFNWKRIPALSSGIQQWALVDTDRDEVLLRLEDGAKPSLTEYGEFIICLLLNDWAERQKEPAPEPEQSEGTCSIRWDDGSWKAYDSSGRVHWFGTDLTNALDNMRSLRFRVLNDPLEVWLEQSGSRAWRIRTLEGFQEKTLRTGSGTLLQYDLAKQECSRKGWRILREEPLKEQATPGPSHEPESRTPV